MDTKKTPGNIANEFANKNANYEGILYVVTMTPKGKYGRRGLATKSTLFYVRDGKAKLTHHRNSDHKRNGQCAVCKHIFLETVLTPGRLPDCKFGQNVPRDMLKPWEPEVVPYHNKMIGYICPACLCVDGVEEGDKPPFDYYGTHEIEGKIVYVDYFQEQCPRYEYDTRTGETRSLEFAYGYHPVDLHQ